MCKGWTCETNDYLPHQCDEFDSIIDNYIDEKYPEGLVDKMERYISRGFYPAYCAVGFFSLVGMSGFKKNLTKSYEYLMKGTEYDIWSCYDILSFHPFTKNIKEHLENATSKGAVWSMLYNAFSSENKTKSLELLIHVLTASTPGWWKKRRSGEEYADAVGSILNMNGKSKENAWDKLKELASKGNLPAAIWVADGYRTGEIGEQNAEKGIKVLIPYISSSPWKFDISDLLEAKDIEDKSILLDIASKTGQLPARAIQSYLDVLI